MICYRLWARVAMVKCSFVKDAVMASTSQWRSLTYRNSKSRKNRSTYANLSLMKLACCVSLAASTWYIAMKFTSTEIISGWSSTTWTGAVKRTSSPKVSNWDATTRTFASITFCMFYWRWTPCIKRTCCIAMLNQRMCSLTRMVRSSWQTLALATSWATRRSLGRREVVLRSSWHLKSLLVSSIARKWTCGAWAATLMSLLLDRRPLKSMECKDCTKLLRQSLTRELTRNVGQLTSKTSSTSAWRKNLRTDGLFHSCSITISLLIRTLMLGESLGRWHTSSTLKPSLSKNRKINKEISKISSQ